MINYRVQGMEPYIEAQLWHDFHPSMIVAIRDELMPQLAPRYIAQIEERVYVEMEDDEPAERRLLRPDVSVRTEKADERRASGETVALLEPARLTLPMPVEQRERFLKILSLPDRTLVTVIELLSPANKRPNSIGRREYLQKRQQILQSTVHLVEIDLLLKGERLPTREELPEGDYYAFVARADQRPAVDVYYWRVGQSLPIIPIPLLAGDPDALLNLQRAYEQVYTRARYDLQLDFSQPLS